LVITIDPDIWPVRVDANEFELAIVNLVLNGRDAMPRGGVISVTAENVTLARSDTKENLEGEFIAFRVSDTGAGIAPDVLQKVFDPFFTTKEVAKGSGLGLSQVHGFVHQSGGTVTIDSELGKGTTVSLYLPRAEEVASNPEADVESSAVGSGRVLLVEDDPEVAEATLSMLGDLGYRVHAVRDADMALEAADQESFDLVVSDIVMGGSMDGLALARVMRQRKPDVPVLLVTGYSFKAAGSESEFVILRKPFGISDLGRAAARVVAEATQSRNSKVVPLRPRNHS
jgi:CheY-like chemotaxis protein